MREDMTFHVLRFMSIADSPNFGMAILSQPATDRYFLNSSVSKSPKMRPEAGS